MMMIYVINAANRVGTVEVPLGANLIPKGTALEYSAVIPLCILLAFFCGMKNVPVLFSSLSKRHTQDRTAAVPPSPRRPAVGLPCLEGRYAGSPKSRVREGSQRATLVYRFWSRYCRGWSARGKADALFHTTVRSCVLAHQHASKTFCCCSVRTPSTPS